MLVTANNSNTFMNDISLAMIPSMQKAYYFEHPEIRIYTLLIFELYSNGAGQAKPYVALVRFAYTVRHKHGPTHFIIVLDKKSLI